MSAVTVALRPLLQEAFEAGRVIGRDEAALDLRAKIDGVLAAGPRQASAPVKAIAPHKASHSGKRAHSGSVKPTISGMIEKAPNGLTADEIHTATNFKPNSIRGTLWTLGNEGLTVRRDGRWYWKAKSSSPEGETEAPTASAHPLVTRESAVGPWNGASKGQWGT